MCQFLQRPASDVTKYLVDFSNRATGRVCGIRATVKSEVVGRFLQNRVNGVSLSVVKRFHCDSGTEVMNKEVRDKVNPLFKLCRLLILLH